MDLWQIFNFLREHPEMVVAVAKSPGFPALARLLGMTPGDIDRAMHPYFIPKLLSDSLQQRIQHLARLQMFPTDSKIFPRQILNVLCEYPDIILTVVARKDFMELGHLLGISPDAIVTLRSYNRQTLSEQLHKDAPLAQQLLYQISLWGEVEIRSGAPAVQIVKEEFVESLRLFGISTHVSQAIFDFLIEHPTVIESIIAREEYEAFARLIEDGIPAFQQQLHFLSIYSDRDTSIFKTEEFFGLLRAMGLHPEALESWNTLDLNAFFRQLSTDAALKQQVTDELVRLGIIEPTPVESDEEDTKLCPKRLGVPAAASSRFGIFAVRADIPKVFPHLEDQLWMEFYQQ